MHSPALPYPFSRAEITVDLTAISVLMCKYSSLLSSELFADEVSLTGRASRKKKNNKNNQKLIKTCFKGVYVYTRSLQEHRRHFEVERMCKVWATYLCSHEPMLKGPSSHKQQKKQARAEEGVEVMKSLFSACIANENTSSCRESREQAAWVSLE